MKREGITYSNGDKRWFLNGEYHREDGPAIEWADGTKKWFRHGKVYTPTAHEVITYKLK